MINLINFSFLDFDLKTLTEILCNGSSFEYFKSQNFKNEIKMKISQNNLKNINKNFDDQKFTKSRVFDVILGKLKVADIKKRFHSPFKFSSNCGWCPLWT